MSFSPKLTSLALACGLLTSTSALALERGSVQLAQRGPDAGDEEGGGGPQDKAPREKDRPAGEKAPREKSAPGAERGAGGERGEGRRARDDDGNDGDAPARPARERAKDAGDEAPPKKRPPPAADDEGPAPKAERPAPPPKKELEKQAPKPAPELDDGVPPPKQVPPPKKSDPEDRKPAPAPKAEPKDVPKAKDLPKEVPKEAPKAPRPAEKDLDAKDAPPVKDRVKDKDDGPLKDKQPAPGETKPGELKPLPDKQGRPAEPAPGRPDGAAEGKDGGKDGKDAKQPQATAPEVKDLKELKQERKERSEDGGKRVIIEEPDKRAIIKEGGRTVIRHDETERFRRLDGGRTRREKRDGLDISISIRPGGIEIYTEMDDRGRPLRRYRRGRDGRDVILFDNRDFYSRHRDGSFIEAIVDLPPPRLSIPRERYIVDYEEASDVEVYEALSAPPVEEIDRTYSLEEVRRSPMLRDRMRRVDLDAINFEFGAWEVASDQYPALERVARAMKRVIEANPDEMFLVEGHTDAVGSDEDNLSLSDRRAEAVSIILTEEFNVPPENMTTQGYGEQYLKVQTEAAERQNRRVAVRRITPLLSRK